MQISENKSVLSKEELQKRKRRRAKARAAVLTVFVILTLVIVFAVLLRTVLFPIESVTVSGNITVTSAQILDTAGVSVGDKLFSVSESALNKKLTVKYPYIKKVDLKYPSLKELRINITETEDVFCYNCENSFFTADADNKILSKHTEQPENTVLIIPKTKINPECGYILSLESDELDTVKEIYNYLNREEIEINSIDISNSNFVTLKIKDRFVVSLGSLTDLLGKLEHLRGMLPQIDTKNGNDITGEIDLSAWSPTKREGFFKPKTLD